MKNVEKDRERKKNQKINGKRKDSIHGVIRTCNPGLGGLISLFELEDSTTSPLKEMFISYNKEKSTDNKPTKEIQQDH